MIFYFSLHRYRWNFTPHRTCTVDRCHQVKDRSHGEFWRFLNAASIAKSDCPSFCSGLLILYQYWKYEVPTCCLRDYSTYYCFYSVIYISDNTQVHIQVKRSILNIWVFKYTILQRIWIFVIFCCILLFLNLVYIQSMQPSDGCIAFLRAGFLMVSTVDHACIVKFQWFSAAL